MMRTWAVLVLCTTACGSIADQPPPADADEGPPADASIDAPPPPRTYRARLAETAPTMFGGTPFCLYTIQLRQLDVALGVTPAGEVRSGQVQALNVETPSVTCPNMGIPPTIANYSFERAVPTMAGQQLAFRGAAANNPRVNLVIDLMAMGADYQARLAFRRTDQAPPLDWMVTTTVSLIAQ